MATATFAEVAAALAAVGMRFYARGWTLGTSGNFSAAVSKRPVQLAITASGLNKRELTPSQILLCNERGAAVGRSQGAPSNETLLHIEVVRRRQVGAVLHTHSVWSTMLSERHAAAGGLTITGLEMLKGLKGVVTHEHREWLPILDNDQDMARLSAHVGEMLTRHPEIHGFLLHGHGLYTWGDTIAEAEKHVEILEFLLETTGRSESLKSEV